MSWLNTHAPSFFCSSVQSKNIKLESFAFKCNRKINIRPYVMLR